MVSAASLPGSFGVALARETSSGKAMCKSMSSDTQIYGFDPAKLGDFLRARYPENTTKLAAAALSAPGLPVSPRTVENWLSGASSPGDFRLVGRMIEVWEADFILAVMARPSQWARDAKAAREFLELERRRSELAFKLGLALPEA